MAALAFSGREAFSRNIVASYFAAAFISVVVVVVVVNCQKCGFL